MLTFVAAAYDARAKGRPRFIKSRCAEMSTTTSLSSGDGKCLSQTAASTLELVLMLRKISNTDFDFIRAQDDLHETLVSRYFLQLM